MPSYNRRDYSRLDYETDVVIRHRGRELEGISLNISQGGMFVEAEPLPLGEKVTAIFELPDLDAPIEAEAIVRWNSRDIRPGIGLQFTGLRALEVWGVNQLFHRAERDKG